MELLAALPAAARLDEVHAYRLPGAIDPMTLRRYFALHAADRDEVGRCRGAANTLGFAVQLCTLRWRGHFLRDMAGVPLAAIETLAEQVGFLSLALVASLENYPASVVLPRFAWIMPPSERVVGEGRSWRDRSLVVSAS